MELEDLPCIDYVYVRDTNMYHVVLQSKIRIQMKLRQEWDIESVHFT